MAKTALLKAEATFSLINFIVGKRVTSASTCGCPFNAWRLLGQIALLTLLRSTIGINWAITQPIVK
jgi:hypothetical protein